jgi:hypothetical protein
MNLVLMDGNLATDWLNDDGGWIVISHQPVFAGVLLSTKNHCFSDSMVGSTPGYWPHGCLAIHSIQY